MILNSLYEYYNQMNLHKKANSLCDKHPVYDCIQPSYLIELSTEGVITDVINLKELHKNNFTTEVPRISKKSCKISVDFLTGNSACILGFDERASETRVQQLFEAFRRFNLQVLVKKQGSCVEVFKRFLMRYTIQDCMCIQQVKMHSKELSKAKHIVFRLRGKEVFLHDEIEMKESWEDYHNQKAAEYVSQCLVTGKRDSIARIHPLIKGLRGSHPTGATMISFDKDAFHSYGKSQGYNAPVSEAVATGYTQAINQLLRDPLHSIMYPTSTLLLWADTLDAKQQVEVCRMMLSSETLVSEHLQENQSSKHLEKRQAILSQTPDAESYENLADVKLSMLLISPNKARVSIRFWTILPFHEIFQHLLQHNEDLQLDTPYNANKYKISIQRILRQTISLSEEETAWEKKIAPNLESQLIASIITGRTYPYGLILKIMTEIKKDGIFSYLRVAMIKAYLTRKMRYKQSVDFCWEQDLKKLEKHSKSIAYQLGRLFFTIERVHVNVGEFKKHYLALASTRPQAIFPLLLWKVNHIGAKAVDRNQTKREIEKLWNFNENFPVYLNLEQQCMFILGYFHQKNDESVRGTKGEANCVQYTFEAL